MLTVERIVLVALPVCVGLFVGMVMGAAFFVPADSGLAGPAIALVYGLVGGAAALAGGTLVVRQLDARSLRRSLVVAGVLVAVIAVWIGAGCRLLGQRRRPRKARRSASIFAPSPRGPSPCA